MVGIAIYQQTTIQLQRITKLKKLRVPKDLTGRKQESELPNVLIRNKTFIY